MKDKIHWTWKRIIGVILGVLGIGTLTSCYGVIEDEFEYSIYGQVKGKINGTEQAIEGIAVALYNTAGGARNITLTDSDGWYDFRALEGGSYTITYTDIDGDKNGSFKQKELEIPLKEDFNSSVTLENAN